MERAVVLLSGGQDSTTCLGWAIDRWGPDNVYPVSIDYGQRHSVELRHAKHIADMLDVREPFTMLMPMLDKLGAAALTNPNIEPNVDATGSGNVFAEAHNLPSTFVPGRNVLFITSALAFGAKFGIYNVVTGVCQTDRAGYPDCRHEFITSLETTLSYALDEFDVQIYTPLMFKSKGETFALAKQLGILDIVLEHSHTCYNGDRSARFDWGYGCGACGACIERRDGYEEFRRLERDAAARA